MRQSTLGEYIFYTGLDRATLCCLLVKMFFCSNIFSSISFTRRRLNLPLSLTSWFLFGHDGPLNIANIYMQRRKLWAPYCVCSIILLHTPHPAALNPIIPKSPSQRQVSHTVLFPHESFLAFTASAMKVLEIKKFEKLLTLQPSNSHMVEAITHSGGNDILKEAELRQMALCHHYFSIIPTHSPSLCCSQQLQTFKVAGILEHTPVHTY